MVARHLATHRSALRRELTRTPPPRGNPLTLIIVSALGTFLVGSLLLVGVAVVGVTAAVTVLSSDLPDPANLTALTCAERPGVCAGSGKVQLGGFQRE